MPHVHTAESATLASQFQTLAAQWKAATAVLSSTTAMVTHPTYQAIIALGPPVVPLLLQEFGTGAGTLV